MDYVILRFIVARKPAQKTEKRSFHVKHYCTQNVLNICYGLDVTYSSARTRSQNSDWLFAALAYSAPLISTLNVLELVVFIIVLLFVLLIEKRYYVFHPTTRFVCVSVCVSVCTFHSDATCAVRERR